MKIKEIEADKCGKCPLIDWCCDPYEEKLCTDRRFAEMEVEEYIRLAQESLCGSNEQIAEDVLKKSNPLLIDKERLTEWRGGKAIPRMDLRNNGYERCVRKLALIEDLKDFKRKTKEETLAAAESISPEKLEKAGCPTDIYIQEKQSGKIHRLGTDPHDAIWVDENGTLHYMNMQNGDGCDGAGDNESCGYRFCTSDCGVLEE